MERGMSKTSLRQNSITLSLAYLLTVYTEFTYLHQVRERCKKEWAIFDDRMANAERAYFQAMGKTFP